MTSRRTFGAVALTFSAAALFALSYGGIAHAITDTLFRYSTPKAGYLSLGPMSFAPADSSTTPNYTSQSGDFLEADNTGCFVAPVNLPQGAALTNFTAWVSGPIAGVDVKFIRHNLATGAKVVIAELTMSNADFGRLMLNQSITPALTVNNQVFNYGVSVCVQAAARYYAGRVAYTYQDAGD